MRDKVTFTAGRIGQLILSVFVMSVIVFFVSRIAPGNPLRAYYGEAVERMSPEQLESARQRLGLDDSLITQYFRWLGDALHGDFGISYQYRQPVADVIGQVWGNTAWLTVASLVFIFALGIPLAVFCARREGQAADRIICRIGVAAGSVPEFFVALILILVFSVTLHWLPQSGTGTAANLVLPVASIVISHLWYCAYLIRNRLIEEMGKEYVLMCKVKGLSENAVIYKHCLRNILPSIISIAAIFLPHLLGGAYVVEIVFSYPGLGKLGLESAQYHDYNMLMLICLITGIVVIAANILAQILNRYLSPEREEERGQML
ncbi:MAG: ABC transporter permease [Lentihominibacter sp.]|nr:ABC transporter permease [Lentihominibacter sp.]